MHARKAEGAEVVQLECPPPGVKTRKCRCVRARKLEDGTSVGAVGKRLGGDTRVADGRVCKTGG